MKELIQNLIEALREELKQYGEMLALLDHQQRLAAHRHPPELSDSMGELKAQAAVIQVARQEREQRRRHLARTLALDESSSLAELTPWMPKHYQPLLQALVQENNELSDRVQHRVLQNQLVLSRAVDFMQRLTSWS
jgi:hypothetical protein